MASMRKVVTARQSNDYDLHKDVLVSEGSPP
jgi:hypothetical protein